MFFNTYAGNVNSISFIDARDREFRVKMHDFQSIFAGKTAEIETEMARKYDYITKLKMDI